MIAQRSQQSISFMDCYGGTHRGLVRDTNQDCYLITDLSHNPTLIRANMNSAIDNQTLPLDRRWLLGVADGMGGHAAGDRASQLAIETAGEFVRAGMTWLEGAGSSRQALSKLLRSVVGKCDQRLKRDIREHPEHTGMGTTLTLGYLDWPHCFGVHAGDSRCYLCRRGSVGRVTNDHTFAQLLAERSDGKPEEIPSQWHHTLWNYIGGEKHELLPDVFEVELQAGDTLLFCSDGLTRHLADDEIANYLCRDQSARSIGESLIDRANELGGDDNTTVVIARFC